MAVRSEMPQMDWLASQSQAAIAQLGERQSGRLKTGRIGSLAFFPLFYSGFGGSCVGKNGSIWQFGGGGALFGSHFSAHLRPTLARRPLVIFLDFPCFIAISAVLGKWEPNAWHFQHPTNTTIVGKNPVRCENCYKKRGEVHFCAGFG